MNAQRSETEFVDGLRIYAPNERAPDYIIANAAIDRDALTAWLAGRAPQIRVVIKRSKGGKLYAAVDAYERDAEPRPKDGEQAQRQRPQRPGSQSQAAQAAGDFQDDDIPF